MQAVPDTASAPLVVRSFASQITILDGALITILRVRQHPDRLIATTKDHKQRRAARELGHTNGPPPPDATPVQEMEHLLRTPQGATAYKQRSQLIEPVFGDRKHNRQIRSFRRRGLNAVRSEWAFIHLTANILKLYQHHRAAALA